MAFLPDVRRQWLEKLFNSDWMKFFYNEPTETWQEKYRSSISKWWNQSATFVASKTRFFFAHWYIYVIFIAGTLVVLTIHKSRRYLRTIKFREKINSEIQIGEQTCSADEETVIVSKDYNDEEEEHRDGTFVKPCPTFTSNLDDPTTTGDNDQLDHELFKLSEMTVVPYDSRIETGDFLEYFINSIEPGHDDEIEKPISFKKHSQDLRESTLQKVNSGDKRRFYVLTPWVDGVDEEWLSDQSNDAKTKINLTELSPNFTESNNDDLIPSALEKSNPLIESEENETLTNSKESNIDDEIVTTLEDFVKKNLDSSSTNVNEESEKCHDANHSTKSEQPVDCSEPPRSRNSRRTIEINDKESMEASDSVPKPTNSKHRFRSLSYDDRPVSSTVNLDARRGGSASPPLRNKNKLRLTKQAQSRIPTLSPPALMNQRVLRHYDAIDGSISEASDQIRSALLRKLREVWAQHPRNVVELSSRLKNLSPSNGSPIDAKLPDSGSRIPLPRKFSRGRPFQ